MYNVFSYFLFSFYYPKIFNILYMVYKSGKKVAIIVFLSEYY